MKYLLESLHENHFMYLPGRRNFFASKSLHRSHFIMFTAILSFLTLLAAGLCIVLAALAPSYTDTFKLPDVVDSVANQHHISKTENVNITTHGNSNNSTSLAESRNHSIFHYEPNQSSVISNQDFSEVRAGYNVSSSNPEITRVMSDDSYSRNVSYVNDIIMRSLPSENVEPYDLSNGPLLCDQVWPLLEKKSKGTCKLTRSEGSSLPDVVCAYIGGYRPIAGSYTALLYSAATYHLVDTPVRPLSPGESDRSFAGYCAFQTRFEQRKVDSLSKEDAPVGLDESLLKIAESEGEQDGTHRALVSQGLKSVSLDLRPDALGAKGAMFAIPHCQDGAVCDLDIWVIKYAKNINIVHLYMNRAWRIIMEFNPAYMKLATYLLNYLKDDAYIEVLAVNGGERWDDGTVLPVTLKRLRSIDFSSNGLSKLDDVNFERTPELVELNLSHNNFSTVPNGVSLLRQLRVLDMSYNPLVPKSLVPVLRFIPFLRTLNLSFTKLGGFEPLADWEDDGASNNTSLVPNLQMLDLSGCNITNLTSPAVQRVLRRTLLRRLHLSSNPLETPAPSWLIERLPSLEVLALANCSLRQSSRLRLAPGVRLDLLDLADNKLETPTDILDENTRGVRELNLSGNPLRQGGVWDAGTFRPLGVNASVNLSRVGAETLGAPMLRALESLRQVDLGGNPLDCNLCATSGLRDWLTNRTRPAVLSLGSKAPLQCAHPPSARGRSVVASLAFPPREACAPRQQRFSGGLSGAAVAGTVVAVALLAAAFLALLAFRFRLELVYVLHVLRANRAVKASNLHSGAGDGDEGDECEFDAFVCYSKFDRAWVIGELLPRLEDSSPRYRLCLHERDFPLGSLIVQNIVECMARSRRTLIVLTRAFIDSQWCQWELEMATQRLLDSACRDYLVLVELERLEVRALPRLLRLLVETRTFLQWPEGGCTPAGCCGRGGESAVENAWRRLRAALGPPLLRKETEDVTVTRSNSFMHPSDRLSSTRRKSPTKDDKGRRARKELHSFVDSPINNTRESPSQNRTPKLFDLDSDIQKIARKRNTFTREGSKDSNLGRNRGSIKASNREVHNLLKTEKESNENKTRTHPNFCNDKLHRDVNFQLNSAQICDPSSSADMQQNALNALKSEKNYNAQNSEIYSCTEDRKCISSKNNNVKNIFIIDVPNENNSFDVV